LRDFARVATSEWFRAGTAASQRSAVAARALVKLLRNMPLSGARQNCICGEHGRPLQLSLFAAVHAPAA
jgi:hypothetical protein